jgi:hypothetical protein
MFAKNCTGLLLVVAGCGCGGELADKPAWAALQSVEFEDRSSTSSGTEIRRLSNRYVALAVQGRGEMQGGPVGGPRQPRRSWILLNEHAADSQVKQMVTFPAYDLRCSDVDKVQRHVADIDAYVILYLRTICRR